jgi:hypothetical protein
MTCRSRFAAILLAALIVFISIAASGCTGGPYQITEGSDVWTLAHKGSSTEVMLNSKLYAVMQNGTANVFLPDGRSLDVSFDNSGSPVSITRMAWEVQLSQQDYAQMNTAFYVFRQSAGQSAQGSLGWVIFLLIVIVAGVLLFIYAGTLVNSWKLGGIFSGNDTARSLLIFKAIGILLIVIGTIILLAVIF